MRKSLTGKLLRGGSELLPAAAQRVHTLCCNEYHQHQAPKCCADDCWCRSQPAAQPDATEVAEKKERLIRFAEQIWDEAKMLGREGFVAAWAGNVLPASHVIVPPTATERGKEDK